VKIIATVLALFAMASCGVSQGLIDFNNSSSTLISVGGSAMPVSGEQQFFFALFLAPGNTVATQGITPTFTHPAFQLAEAYNTNHALVPGRLASRASVVANYPAGSTVDCLVRGWSANAGTTWSEALANWNNGSPSIPMFIGSSTAGNNILLGGGGFPTLNVFGSGTYQVLGFNMIFVPEPSALALAVLGGAALWARLRWRKRESA